MFCSFYITKLIVVKQTAQASKKKKKQEKTYNVLWLTSTQTAM